MPIPKLKVEIVESFRGLKKGDKIECFIENKNGYCFEAAGEHDTFICTIPKDKAIKLLPNK